MQNKIAFVSVLASVIFVVAFGPSTQDTPPPLQWASGWGGEFRRLDPRLFDLHFESGRLLHDIVIGASDGLTVPFALAAGLSGAVSSSRLIIIAGLAARFYLSLVSLSPDLDLIDRMSSLEVSRWALADIWLVDPEPHFEFTSARLFH